MLKRNMIEAVLAYSHEIRQDSLRFVRITQALRRFIDEYSTVSIHGNTVGKDVARIAGEVNKHHHTKTCRKHDTTCRFGYPRLPAPYTIVVEPCKADTPARKEKLLTKYRKVISKVQDVIEDEDAMQKIMSQYDKQNETKEEYTANREKRIKQMCQLADVSYDEYIKAISTSKTGYTVNYIMILYTPSII